MLKMTGITKSFGSKRALDNVDLSFAPRQTHILLGSSGSGKSTLLRIILGLQKPDSGTVSLDGENIVSENQEAWAAKIGYVPQEGGLFPHFTAADNVSLVARILKWTPARIEARMKELAEIAGLEPASLRRFPAEISGGQRQRVSIMRAAFLDPQLMILDEPLGALDPILRSELQSELKKIFNRLGKTVIMVTHDVGEAAFFGHTITLLRLGKTVQSGTLADLIERPAAPFVTEFINAQRTLADYRAFA